MPAMAVGWGLGMQALACSIRDEANRIACCGSIPIHAVGFPKSKTTLLFAWPTANRISPSSAGTSLPCGNCPVAPVGVNVSIIFRSFRMSSGL